MLRCQLFVWIIIILPLREHVIDQPDGQQIEVGDADTELHTAQQKEHGGHFPLTFERLFRNFTSVCNIQPPQFDQLGQNLIDREGVELV